jgi:hypothetical protein
LCAKSKGASAVSSRVTANARFPIVTVRYPPLVFDKKGFYEIFQDFENVTLVNGIIPRRVIRNIDISKMINKCNLYF